MPFDYKKYHEDYRRENYDRIQILLPKGGKALAMQAAAREGLSLNRWAMLLIMNAAEQNNEKKEG